LALDDGLLLAHVLYNGSLVEGQRKMFSTQDVSAGERLPVYNASLRKGQSLRKLVRKRSNCITK
jgi:hypothetical protein